MKKQLLPYLMAAVLVMPIAAGAQTVRLRIVTPYEKAVIQTDTASAIEKYAAVELQRAIQLMTGTLLNIIHKTQTITDAKIIIGNTKTNSRVQQAAAVLQLNGGGDEKIAVKKEGYILYLAGNTSRGALYATYTFLQDYLGARWYWPDSRGEFLPKRDSIVLDQPLFISHTPHLEVRSIAVTGFRTAETENWMELTDVWMARNRLNWVSDRTATAQSVIPKRRAKGFFIRRAGHNVAVPNELITAAKLQGADSVLAAWRGGKRQTQGTSSNPEHMCWSNPRGWDSVAKMLVSWWNKHPYPDVIHFYPADIQRYCLCTPCSQMAPDISTRWQKFSDSVLKRIKTLSQQLACSTTPHADTSFRCDTYWTYAYWDYKVPPTSPVAPFQFIPYALDDGCYRHPLSNDVNIDNNTVKAHINGWLAKTGQIGIRGYEFIMFKSPMHVPLVSWVTDQMKWIKKKGLKGYLSELPYYGNPLDAEPENTWWNCSRMSLYAAAKALWDTSVTASDLVLDWCDKVYGPAKYDMNNYYWDMDSAWQAGTKRIVGFNKTPRLYFDGFITNSTLFHKSYKRFADALHRIATDVNLDSVQKNRIEGQILFEREMLDNWMDTFQTAHGREYRYRKDIQRRTSTGVHATVLDTFEVSWGQATANHTEVTVGWTDNNLHLRITTPEQNLIIDTTYQRNDQTPFTHGLEIYIHPDSTKPQFYRLRINPASGTFVDARTYSGIAYDSTWNAPVSVWTGKNFDILIYNIQIPFSALGITAADSTMFRLGVRRKASNGTITGWPEAQSSYAGLFSLVTLVDGDSINNSYVHQHRDDLQKLADHPPSAVVRKHSLKK